MNLVIVESPAKAKTIEGYLGKDFVVKSSFGHVRDLVKKGMGIDIENDFNPTYEISPDKKKIITELKSLTKKSDSVWLATDEDREGEAISWHLATALNLNMKNTKRIVFHEITKEAILNAVKKPRTIDQNLVNAQQARRILDRLVGFELSPILWKKIKPSLSAGRVQSVAVRLIVEREREILNFNASSFYKVSAIFDAKGEIFKAELKNNFKTKKEALDFLEKCKEAIFTVGSVEKKPTKKNPSPPFTTSTLQQEASRKLGFNLRRTMSAAQKLYENGKITYMRTDSVNLSENALKQAEKVISQNYGEKYLEIKQYKTKSKSAQEAHEAIRPTYLEHSSVEGDYDQVRLYDLIWKRTIASQMAEAELERTIAIINISTTSELFEAKGEVIKFDGFLKVYLESTDEEPDSAEASTGKDEILPILVKGQSLQINEITAMERFSRPPARYTEASLVKKLEELGIGRPSTYAPTISTIQDRGYVTKEEREGMPRELDIITLIKKDITEDKKTEITGADKGKLSPTDIGMVVNDFLIKHFPNILDYNFTAKVEKDFDDIAEGKMEWVRMLKDFYHPFHETVEITLETSERASGERKLGIDPKSGKNIYARIGKFGPLVQIGESDDPNKIFAGLRKEQRLEKITLEEALELFKLPRIIGTFEKKEMKTAIGRFGPYIQHNDAYYSIPKEEDPLEITKERGIEIIKAKRKADAEKVIKTFEKEGREDIQLLNGRWGAYLKIEKNNYKLPKDKEPTSFTLEELLSLKEEQDKNPRPKFRRGGKR